MRRVLRDTAFVMIHAGNALKSRRLTDRIEGIAPPRIFADAGITAHFPSLTGDVRKIGHSQTLSVIENQQVAIAIEVWEFVFEPIFKIVLPGTVFV